MRRSAGAFVRRKRNELLVIMAAGAGAIMGLSAGAVFHLRIPVIPITHSSVIPITDSTLSDHQSERSDAGVCIMG